MTIASASPREVALDGETLEKQFLGQDIRRLMGDLAYDGDPSGEQLVQQGIELITPDRGNPSARHAIWSHVASLQAAAGRSNGCECGAKLPADRRVVRTTRHEHLGFILPSCLLILAHACL